MDNLTEILIGCKRNDRLSQEKLYKQFYPGLFALCKKFFRDNHDIISALNMGMLNVYKNINQYDANKGELFNWAYTIVRNTALTQVRLSKEMENTTEITPIIEQQFQDNPFSSAEWNDIYCLLDKLPQATRVVCTLFYLEDYNIKEISEQLNISQGTVKWHLSESRSKLKVLITNN